MAKKHEIGERLDTRKMLTCWVGVVFVPLKTSLLIVKLMATLINESLGVHRSKTS